MTCSATARHGRCSGYGFYLSIEHDEAELDSVRTPRLEGIEDRELTTDLCLRLRWSRSRRATALSYLGGVHPELSHIQVVEERDPESAGVRHLHQLLDGQNQTERDRTAEK